MTDYWRSHPPVHLMVAAYLGIKPERKQKQDDGDMLAFFQHTQALGGAL